MIEPHPSRNPDSKEAVSPASPASPETSAAAASTPESETEKLNQVFATIIAELEKIARSPNLGGDTRNTANALIGVLTTAQRSSEARFVCNTLDNNFAFTSHSKVSLQSAREAAKVINYLGQNLITARAIAATLTLGQMERHSRTSPYQIEITVPGRLSKTTAAATTSTAGQSTPNEKITIISNDRKNPNRLDLNSTEKKAAAEIGSATTLKELEEIVKHYESILFHEAFKNNHSSNLISQIRALLQTPTPETAHKTQLLCSKLYDYLDLKTKVTRLMDATLIQLKTFQNLGSSVGQIITCLERLNELDHIWVTNEGTKLRSAADILTTVSAVALAAEKSNYKEVNRLIDKVTSLNYLCYRVYDDVTNDWTRLIKFLNQPPKSFKSSYIKWKKA